MRGTKLTYVADRLDLGRATLDADVERECFDSTASTLEILLLKEYLLELRVGRSNVAELVVPLVDGRVRQPERAIASVILSWSATEDFVVLERELIVPASLFRTSQIGSRLLPASEGSGIETGAGCTCVRHDAGERPVKMCVAGQVEGGGNPKNGLDVGGRGVAEQPRVILC